MVTRRYVGKTPSSDSALVPKGYIDDVIVGAVFGEPARIVDLAFVDAAIDDARTANALQTTAYVDGKDAVRATTAAVAAADATYVAAATRGQPGGVAALDGTGALPLAQTPAGVPTSRVARTYTAAANGTVYLTSTQQVATTNVREYKIASIVIPDPGYPWRPLCFGVIGGYSNGGTPPADSQHGTGGMGQVTVMPPAGVSDQPYGIALCTGTANTKTGYYPILPYATSGYTSLTVPKITGSLELDLWGCNYTLTNYVFVAAGLFFGVQVTPAI